MKTSQCTVISGLLGALGPGERTANALGLLVHIAKSIGAQETHRRPKSVPRSPMDENGMA